MFEWLGFCYEDVPSRFVLVLEAEKVCRALCWRLMYLRCRWGGGSGLRIIPSGTSDTPHILGGIYSERLNPDSLQGRVQRGNEGHGPRHVLGAKSKCSDYKTLFLWTRTSRKLPRVLRSNGSSLTLPLRNKIPWY